MSFHNIELTDENIVEIANNNHSRNEFEYLVTSHQHDVRAEVAKNPHLPAEFAKWMAGDTRQEVRAALAANPTIDIEVISILSQETNLAVLAGIAANPSTPKEILIELAKHRSYLVRDAAASNKSMPAETLDNLSKDSVWGVRRRVAENPKSTEATLQALASDSSFEVLSALSENPSSTSVILHKLLDNSDSNVLRDAILENPSFPEPEAIERYKEALIRKADDAEDTEYFGETDVRIAIAQRPNLSESFIEIIIKDPYYIVRSYLARNLSVPDKYLAELALDSNESVRTDVVKNPNASSVTKASATLLGVEADSNDD